MREPTESSSAADTDRAQDGGDWSADEVEAWDRLRQGLPADAEVAVLSEAFLRRILADEPYRSVLGRCGLHIVGAQFPDALRLSDLLVSHRVTFDRCRFESSLVLAGLRADRRVAFERCDFLGDANFLEARINGELSLNGSRFHAGLDGSGLRTENDVVLDNIVATDASFTQATIAGQLHIDGARFRDVDLQGVRVAADLFLRESTFRMLDLQDATIGGQFSADDARVRKILDLQGASIASDAYAEHARITSMILTDAKIGGRLLMRRTVCARLSMNRVSIGSNFEAEERCRFGRINLDGAEVRGNVALADARVRGRLSMQRMQCQQTMSIAQGRIGGRLDLRAASILGDLLLVRTHCRSGIELRRARIAGQANFAGSRVDGWLDMECLEVGTYVFLRDSEPDDEPAVDGGRGARFDKVSLVDAKVHGTVYARGSIFDGEVKLNGLETEYLWLRESVFNDVVNFRSGTVRHDLELGGSRFEHDVDLRGSSVSGCLALGSDDLPGPTWRPGAKLFLADASAARVTDREPAGKTAAEAWPERLSLNGFQYERLGGYEQLEKRQNRMSNRSANWFIEWLRRDSTFSKGVYGHLAEVLTRQSELELADEIRFEARECDRQAARGTPRWWLLTALRWTIGYGIGGRFFYSLAWVGLLSAVGFAVFWGTAALPLRDPASVWLFSLDRLLPIVSIYANSDDLAKDCHGWAAAYLALHRALGFILSSFVVAGLSGLTQK